MHGPGSAGALLLSVVSRFINIRSTATSRIALPFFENVGPLTMRTIPDSMPFYPDQHSIELDNYFSTRSIDYSPTPLSDDFFLRGVDTDFRLDAESFQWDLPPLSQNPSELSYRSAAPLSEGEASKFNNLRVVTPSKSIFICFTNRSGSNYVAEAMAGDGQILAAGEYLNFDTVIEHSEAMNFYRYYDYLLWLTTECQSNAGIFALKCSIGQLMYLYHHDLFGVFGENLYFVHVKRSDLLAQAVSYHIASKTNQWVSTQKGNNTFIAYDPVTISSIACSFGMQNGLFDAFFRLIGIHPLSICYEEFCRDPVKGVAAIGDHVEISGLRFNPETISLSVQSGALNRSMIDKLTKDFNIFQSKQAQ